MAARGALIVFEGCDRVGKSTQCRKLVEKLAKRGAAAKLMKFPGMFDEARFLHVEYFLVYKCSIILPHRSLDRSTVIGKQIDDYLQQKVELPDPAVHLLFAANRWELVWVNSFCGVWYSDVLWHLLACYCVFFCFCVQAGDKAAAVFWHHTGHWSICLFRCGIHGCQRGVCTVLSVCKCTNV